MDTKEQEMNLYRDIIKSAIQLAWLSANENVLKEIANNICDDFRKRFND